MKITEKDFNQIYIRNSEEKCLTVYKSQSSLVLKRTVQCNAH